jgi:hypothetical protein
MQRDSLLISQPMHGEALVFVSELHSSHQLPLCIQLLSSEDINYILNCNKPFEYFSSDHCSLSGSKLEHEL